MDKASIINNYISKHLARAEKGEVATYIAEKSGINKADVERYLEIRSGISRMIGRIAQGSDKLVAEMAYMESETDFDKSFILTMNYYFRSFQIEKGLDVNKYFIMIYPTLDSYLEAEEEDKGVAIVVQEKIRTAEADPKEKTDDGKVHKMT